MDDQYHIPLRIKISRKFLQIFFKALFRTLGKVELIGLDNIPNHNKYVVAFNHISMVEIPFIGSFWPTTLEIIGALAVWSRGYQGLVARMWAGIQVDRTGFDREVFKQVQKIFDADRPLMISPEGTRSHTPGMARGKPGIAYIADKVDAVIVPVAVIGNTLDFLHQGIRGKKPLIQMIVGEPFKLPALEGRGEERRMMRQNNTDYIMARVAAMLPESYQGVYKEYEKILAGEPVIFEEPQA